MTRYSKYIKFLLALSDLALLILCYVAAWFYDIGSATYPFSQLLIYATCSWMFLISIIRPYNISRTSSYFKTLQFTVFMIASHFLLFFAWYVFLEAENYSTRFIVFFYGILFTSLVGYHSVFFSMLKWIRKKGFNYRNIIVIAPLNNQPELVRYLSNHPEFGYHIKWVIDSQKLAEPGTREAIKQYCLDNQVHEVLYSISMMEQFTLDFLMELCEELLLKLRLMADINGIGIKGLELENQGSTAVINIHVTPLDEWDKQMLKRTFDVVFSLGVLVFILSWVFPLVAIGIRIGSRGPVLFTQQRTGRNKRSFTCYKFRSMRVNSESDVQQATRNDPRITRFGAFLRRTSLDELPQFYNVLIGDMSVVGPRPYMLKHTEDFTREISQFMIRHQIRPGITGLAQANGLRGETPDMEHMKERVKLDLQYIRNWSFWLDVKIIFKTVLPNI